MPLKVLSIFGTRPEAIKMAPVVKELNACGKICHKLVVTAQHRQILDQVLDLFNLQPNYDLAIMKQQQSLTEITNSILSGLDHIFHVEKPNLVLVHGDTATTFSAALAAYYKRIPVGHVEAGLRSGDVYSPWPEEGNRKLTSNLCELHFAPTQQAKDNLIRENIAPSSIYVTGNTVIDTLLQCMTLLDSRPDLIQSINRDLNLDLSSPTLLVTGHRRENFGTGFENICSALEILSKRQNIQIIFPVHPNPNVSDIVNKRLGKFRNIKLIPPLDYLPFLFVLKHSKVVLTDSGGIQEEAPALGKPVLVMRDTTERVEALQAGTVKLVGTSVSKIVTEVDRLFNNDQEYAKMANAHNPYGDGNASKRICEAILDYGC